MRESANEKRQYFSTNVKLSLFGAGYFSTKVKSWSFGASYFSTNVNFPCCACQVYDRLWETPKHVALLAPDDCFSLVNDHVVLLAPSTWKSEYIYNFRMYE